MERRLNEARPNEERYRQFVETINDGLLNLDETLAITYCNEQFARMLRYAAPELLGHTTIEFIDEASGKIILEKIEQQKRRTAERYELKWRRRDGAIAPTSVSVRPIFDHAGRYRGCISILTDLSSIKRTEFEPATMGRKIEFDIAPLPETYGDPAMLQRMWQNLLDNAIKYTAPTPNARIEIGAESGGGETVYFVRDNGVGVDMKYATKLFGVFQRLHGAEFPGTGAGLAIVKRIIERHGGRVWAKGKLNEGATLYFSLPAEGTKHASR